MCCREKAPSIRLPKGTSCAYREVQTAPCSRFLALQPGPTQPLLLLHQAAVPGGLVAVAGRFAALDLQLFPFPVLFRPQPGLMLSAKGSGREQVPSIGSRAAPSCAHKASRAEIPGQPLAALGSLQAVKEPAEVSHIPLWDSF